MVRGGGPGGVPSRTERERILETLWRFQMPWIIGLLGSQLYSQGELQEKLWERFQGLSRTRRKIKGQQEQGLEVLGSSRGSLRGSLRGPPVFHWEIKGRFRKRVVLANVPSFRFSFRGKHANVPSFRFLVPGEHPNVPSFRFSLRGNIRQNHPFGNHAFGFLRVLENWSQNAPLRGLPGPSQRPFQSPFQSAIVLSELRALLPLVVLPLEALTKNLSGMFLELPAGLFSFPVLFWCRSYPRFFRSDKGIWGLKKHSFDEKSAGKNSKTLERSLFGAKRAQKRAKKQRNCAFLG